MLLIGATVAPHTTGCGREEETWRVDGGGTHPVIKETDKSITNNAFKFFISVLLPPLPSHNPLQRAGCQYEKRQQSPTALAASLRTHDLFQKGRCCTSG